ncbi:uncharacterized membrane protein YsdA (DUF1294 family) [Rhizobium tibeticum]|uniref:Uncharacterized membrane protein YsdA, DUF1294 family n=1 Tax=Rhizobium tibeticum TaxID=501024 RepID=A0A1H8QFM8_9HYPH|nr:DUF1294 domain-containing protein [Rhizobium tibeticum]MDP9811737.1 uncharacterized membrane protein YsdA (DUF1294 family) [Rhizobium tibeticum]SEI04854.1 hypothetical protein RTCCBAU85039_3991 [Rhizobium tibeticum]SEO53055.1 Uncharacterized membrane protein YsdA, DUF1294 family [Rhizobium tibeticum]
MTATAILKIIGLFLALNAFVFSIYFLDKQAARDHRRRISEKTLLTLAFVGGSLGAVCAQRLLRHKTQKEPFRSILRAIVMFHMVAALVLSGAFGYVALDGPLLD